MPVNEFGNAPPMPVPVKGEPTHTPMRKFRYPDGQDWAILGQWVGNSFQQPEIAPDGRTVIVTYHNCRPDPLSLCNLELPTLATWEEIK